MTATTRSRRLPTQSIKGTDDASTSNLRLLFYLDEVERQAEVFNLSMADAVDAAMVDGNSLNTWRHLQSAMFAAIIVSRLVICSADPKRDGWPGTKAEGRVAAKKAAVQREADLKRLLDLPADMTKTRIFQVAEFRNSLEHIEERLDLALNTTSASSLTDWYVSSGFFLTAAESAAGDKTMAGLRGFYPEGGFVMFHQTILDLFMLDFDMLALRNNARKAKAVLLADVRGRNRFGGGGVVQWPEVVSDRLSWWRETRQSFIDDMAPAIEPDGNVRMWMQVEPGLAPS